MKFGLGQAKTGISAILSKFNVTLSPKTEQPLKLAKGSFVLSAENGIYLKFSQRK